MSLQKKLKSELVEILVFLVFALILGTWMTLTHSIRDLNVVLTQQQKEISELQHLKRSMEKNPALQANITYINERLYIEGSRFNAHVAYYKILLSQGLYPRFRSALPIQQWAPMDLPAITSVDLLIL